MNLDSKGYPKLELAVAVPTESGNPFHNAATGKFAFAPPGVTIVVGKNLVKEMPSNQRKLLFEKAKITNANQLGVTVDDEGNLVFNLFRDGRLLHKFAVSQGGEDGNAKETPSEPSEGERDTIIDAARETNLTGDKLKSFIEERLGVELSDAEFQLYEQQVVAQRINDLVDYLHTNLRRLEQGEKQTNKVRISTPRGYLRKTFASLDVDTARRVLDRLTARGWNSAVVQERVAEKLPKKLREELNVDYKELDPDDKGKKPKKKKAEKTEKI